MPARLIAIGIDAGNPELIRAWAEDGTLPVLGDLIRRGGSGTVRSLDGFFVGSTWPSFYTACSPARHGFHYLVQVRPGTYELYHPWVEGMVSGEPFWRALSRAGKRVAVLDVPLVPLDGTVNGIHLVEWGGHDAVGGFATHPADVGQEILAHHGAHPQPPNCDRIDRSAPGYEEFVSRLERGAAARAAWTRRLLRLEPWDLLLQVFSESHCVGHQAWHLHDPDHPAHDPELAARLGDPLRRVYRAIDAAIGEVLEDAGDSTVAVFSCHGMSHWHGTHLLLREILVRLGVTAPEPPAPPEPALRRAIRAALPGPVRRGVKRLLGRGAETPARGMPDLAAEWRGRIPAADIASRCFPQMNGLAVSGIRMNLRGREPAGLVEPGREREALEAELERELLAIVDERTGRHLIRAVRRTRELHAGPRLDALPDLLVEWNDADPMGSTVTGGRGATVRARSPRIGTVEGTNRYGRTGEHRVEGFFVAAGPGVAPGRLDAPISVMDLAPTFAALLGVRLENVDGRAVELGG